MKNFPDICNHLSIYSRCIDYSIFLKQGINNQKKKEWLEEIKLLENYAENARPLTTKRKILLARDNLVEAYRNCVFLNLPSNKILNNSIKKEIVKINNALQSTTKIALVAQRLKSQFDNILNGFSVKLNSPEIRVVMQYVDMIISVYKEYHDSSKSISKINEIETEILISLEKYMSFLKDNIYSILERINQDEHLYDKLIEYRITNLFEPTIINPYYMFLVFDNIGNRIQYRIIEKEEYALFWEEFKENLKFFREILLKKNNNNELHEYIFSKKIYPDLLYELIDKVQSGSSPSKAIIDISDRFTDMRKPVSEKLIREWLGRNAEFHPEFKGKSYAQILKVLTKIDVETWYTLLAKIDKRFLNR